MGSDSDMEPEEEDFLPNGNDCVAGSCNETLLGEPAVFLCVKKVWKVCTKLSPFSTWLLFFFFNYHDNSTFNYTKTNLIVYAVNMQSFISVHSHTNTSCFSDHDYPVYFQTSLGSFRPAALQHSGTVVQKRLCGVNLYCPQLWLLLY